MTDRSTGDEGRTEDDLVAGIARMSDGQWRRESSLADRPAIEQFAAMGLTLEVDEELGCRLSHAVDLQDLAAVRASYRTAAPDVDADIRGVAVTESTNNDLMATVAEATDQPVFLLTEFQTAGRGRRGRQWTMPYGAGLMFSMQRRFECKPARLTSLSLVVGAAIVQTLSLLGASDLALKWPNDLVVFNQDSGVLRKLGGILVEVATLPGNRSCAVVGLGMNFRLPGRAPAIDQPWLDLAELIPLPRGTRSEITGQLMAALARASEDIDAGRWLHWLEIWRDYDALRGRTVSCSGAVEMQGTAAGIDEDGDSAGEDRQRASTRCDRRSQRCPAAGLNLSACRSRHGRRKCDRLASTESWYCG